MLYENKKKHTGLARYTYKEIKNLFKKYHVKSASNSFELKDAKEASEELENILNELIDKQNMFDYNLFIKEWNRIFNKHYSNRNIYKQEHNLYKLGFLIEIRRYFKFPYICHKNNATIRVDSKAIPITKEIAKSLNKSNEGVDFYIIAIEGLFDDYVSVQVYDKDNVASVKYDYFEFEKISRQIKIRIKN